MTDQGFRSVAHLADPEPEKRRIRAESFADHFSQARQFFQSQTEIEQNHIVAALVFELSKVQLPHVRARVVGQLRNIGDDLAQRVAYGLGMPLPDAIAPAKKPVKAGVSDALSILKKNPPVAGRCLGILVSEGADGAVVEALRAAAQEAKASVKIIAPKVGGVTLANGTQLPADEKIDGAPSVLFDAIALVLSEAGAQTLTAEKAALDFVSDAFAHCKAIGHTEEAQALLNKAGVTADAFVISLSKRPGKLVDHLSTRHWGREASVKLPV